jgi:hypothetical protein
MMKSNRRIGALVIVLAVGIVVAAVPAASTAYYF